MAEQGQEGLGGLGHLGDSALRAERGEKRWRVLEEEIKLACDGGRSAPRKACVRVDGLGGSRSDPAPPTITRSWGTHPNLPLPPLTPAASLSAENLAFWLDRENGTDESASKSCHHHALPPPRPAPASAALPLSRTSPSDHDPSPRPTGALAPGPSPRLEDTPAVGSTLSPITVSPADPLPGGHAVMTQPADPQPTPTLTHH